MALRIEIDIFSGRQNPMLQLKGKEAREALQRLRPVRRVEKGEKGLPPSPTLGYRGLIIEQIGRPARGLPKIFRFVTVICSGRAWLTERQTKGLKILFAEARGRSADFGSEGNFP